MAASAGPKPSSSVAPSFFDMSIGFPPPPSLKTEQIDYCKHAHKILKAKRANGDEIIKKEFYKLEDNEISFTELNRRSSVANLKVNASKNRYGAVIPFDTNRVIIHPIENHSPGMGYINASFITAKANPPDETVSRFIATQGPLPTTYEDFWKMVLKYHCPAVVMLTRLVDPPMDEIGNGDIMCGDYFQGENGLRVIGNMHTVTRKFTETNSSLELRHLEVNHAESQDPPRPVLHIFFRDWPDNGAPRETLAVREIYRRLNNLPSSQVPFVVHCSAGIGRTGTYCVIHNTLQRILAGDMTALELYETVTTFKSQRRGMVQSEEQYIFCFRAIIDELEELVPSLKNAKKIVDASMIFKLKAHEESKVVFSQFKVTVHLILA